MCTTKGIIQHNITINIIDFVSSFVVVTSLLSLISLILGIFKPLNIFLLSLILSLFLLYKYKVRIKIDLNLLLIVLVALFFRIPPYHYIMGGQDEGVYVNMSKYFQVEGKIFVIDSVRERIKKNPRLINLYDKYNFHMLSGNLFTKKKKEGLYLPGIYIKDKSKSQCVFQFYHLHPIWMAIWGSILGDQGRVYSLTFFALLSIIFFYFIVYEITNCRFYASLGASFLSINPLHCFFSKFPVTEVVALAFTLGSFYYFIKFQKTQEKDRSNSLYLFISTLMMGCFFFTRISGFIYIFVFYLVFLYIIAYRECLLRKYYIIYLTLIFLLYGLSVWYGLIFSYPYATDIYRISFSKLFGNHWQLGIYIVISIMILGAIAIYVSRLLSQIYLKISKVFLKFIWIFLFITLVLGLYKLYLLGFTEKYIGDEWLSRKWHIVGRGFMSLLYSSMVVTVEHMSPFIVLIFIFGIIYYNRKNLYLNLLALFLLVFWVYVCIFLFVITYQYYYARYLLSEVVPYSILFTMLFIATYNVYTKKKLMVIIALLSIPYFSYFSLAQFKGREADGAYESLKKVATYIDENDLLILNNVRTKIKTPLRFYFAKHTLNFDFFHENSINFLKEISNIPYFQDIYVLSEVPLLIKYLDYVDSILYKQGFFERTTKIPMNFSYLRINLYLYHLNRCELELLNLKKTKQLNIRNARCLSLVNFYPGRVWTSGNAAIMFQKIPITDETYLKLAVYGWHPYEGKMHKLNLKLFVNGKEAKFLKYKNKSYYFKLPDNIKFIETIEIKSSTFVPKKLGINNDRRNLGIDVKSIEFVRSLK